MHIRATYGRALKHKQPHPNPPLPAQGREPITASTSFTRFSKCTKNSVSGARMFNKNGEATHVRLLP
jgi:hypothetical protein